MTDEEWGAYMTATMRAEDVAEPDYNPDYDLPEHKPEPAEAAQMGGLGPTEAADGEPKWLPHAKSPAGPPATGAKAGDEDTTEDQQLYRYTMDEDGRVLGREAVQPLALEPESRNTWQAEDISDVLDGERPPVVTELGLRADGVPILYRGKEHSIAGEPESGKTWFALMIAAQELTRGNRVTYIDFEDDAGTVVGRLLALGVLKNRLRPDAGQFRYIRPETKPHGDDIVNAVKFGEDAYADVVVYDGITEGATLLGLDVTGGDGQHAVAEFRRKLIRPALTLGCAVLTTDHVVKSTESRGRYAIGAQHKLAGLTGAMFMVDVVATWGRGRRGRSRVLVTKDRNAHLRQNCLPGDKPNVSYFGDLVGNAENEDGLIDVKLYAPIERNEDGDVSEDGPGAPYDRFVEPILKVVGDAPRPLTTNTIVASVKGKKETITTTLAWLIDHGRIARAKDGAAFVHTLPVIPDTDTDTQPGPGSQPGPTGSGTH